MSTPAEQPAPPVESMDDHTAAFEKYMADMEAARVAAELGVKPEDVPAYVKTANDLKQEDAK